MNFVDLINQKKQGYTHTKDEINYIVDSFLKGLVSDAQVAAWLTAVSFKGLTVEETANLTLALGYSGKVIEFGNISNRIVDKHSTGGVGDKLTITLIPLLAAAGVPVAKLADRSVGKAAGTVDKLEAIPNLKTDLSISTIVNQLNTCNAVIASQDDDLAPADKKLYLLRSQIDALNSDPLIASSIISKKLATGASNIIIDVKYGSGAFKQTPDEAIDLARLIVNVGKVIDKSITVLISSMEEPLGRAIGNSLEIIESIEFLKGNIDSGDLAELTYSVAVMTLLQLQMFETDSEALKFLKELVHSGKAIEKCRELINAQGGLAEVIDNYDKFKLPILKVECESKKSGYVHNINAHDVLLAVKELGAGRDNSLRPIDLSVGIYLNKKRGEWVEKGDVLYTIYSNNPEDIKFAQNYCDEAFIIKEGKPVHSNLIYKIVSTNDEDDDV